MNTAKALLHSDTPDDGEMRADVLRGLRSRPKRIPSKYFYDARGSQLFEDICAQPEYYLTRAELEILHTHLDDIAGALGPGIVLLEYGSGSGIKTERLLGRLERPAAYVPVDVSADALQASVARLGQRFPQIPMQPMCEDFSDELALPPSMRGKPVIVFFPGSTIGNFEAHQALALLHHMRRQVGDRGGALVGIDLQKDPAVIEAAYNDAAGVTAAFTLNLLVRLNRELGADFDLTAFRHRARYDEATARIETHLVSTRAQAVHVAGERFVFDAGEAMQVEYSGKYTFEGFATLAAQAGLRIERRWSDAQMRFGVVLLRPL